MRVDPAERMETMKLGKHDYIKLGPGNYRCDTFSVGIFEWVPAKSGGLKKSKAKVRVAGMTSHPEAVWTKADKIVAQLDAGTYTGRKMVVA
jgi:hypothetical protein